MSELVSPQSDATRAILETSSPTTIDSLDAKMVQYQYAVVKLKSLILYVKKLSTNEILTSNLPLVHYILALTGTAFAINEAGFNPRLQLLQQFKLFAATPVTISPNLVHVLYDVPDTPVFPLAEIPTPVTAKKCLKLLDFLLNNCLLGYQKRYDQAKQEKKDPGVCDTLEVLMKDVIFNSLNEIDLNLGYADSEDSLLTFPYPADDTEEMQEATLIDMDITMLFRSTKHFRLSTERLRPPLARIRAIKALPESQKELSFKQLQNSSYTLHKLLLLAFRLNDVYSIVRAVGRKVFLSNYNHLYDEKFSFLNSLPSKNTYKSQILKEINTLFNSTKQNGVLIASITRLIRQSSIHQVNVKNVLDFSNFISQGLTVVENALLKFQEFGFSWIEAELTFRKLHQLPTEQLDLLYKTIRNDTFYQPAAVTAANPTVTSAKTSIDTKMKNLKVDTSAANTRATRSRSSSVSSVGSSSSSTRPPTMSTISTASAGSPTVTKIPSTRATKATLRLTTSSPSRRPNSMIFMNSNGSLQNIQSNSLTSTSSPISTTTTPSGRRRSNSQPISPHKPDIVISSAASGAAAALNKNATANSLSLSRSPNGSIRRSPSLTSKTSSSQASSKSQPAGSPTPLNRRISFISEEKSEEENFLGPTKLTANQRLQQHLRQAAKTGSLMTQEKEVLSRVVFDPNDPSSVNLRKFVDSPPSSIDSPPSFVAVAEVPSSVAPPRTKVTRDQVTKRNTQNNSSIPSLTKDELSSTMDDVSLASNSSTSTSSANGTLVKKVRFTGVPDYTAAEDAPMKYANKILRNFAVFKTPLVYKSKASAFQKKDQQLKKEESYLFKQQKEATGTSPETGVNVSAPSTSAAASAVASEYTLSNTVPAPSTKRLSKIKGKLI